MIMILQSAAAQRETAPDLERVVTKKVEEVVLVLTTLGVGHTIEQFTVLSLSFLLLSLQHTLVSPHLLGESDCFLGLAGASLSFHALLLIPLALVKP